MQNSYFIAIITFVLYIFHYGIVWFIHSYRHKKTAEDLQRFGAEFAFVGISFFVTSIPNKMSSFYRYLGNITDVTSVAMWAILCILIFFILDGGSVFFYKAYMERLKRRPPILSRWMLLLSHCLGIVALGAGLKLL